MSNRFPILILIASCFLFTSGCAWMPWFSGKKKPERFGVISVRLNRLPPKGKRIPYAVASVHKGKRLKAAGFQPLSKVGDASFVLPMGHLYDVRIFHDMNRNQVPDANEPNGLVENLSPVSPAEGEAVPVTIAFGVIGPVATRVIPDQSTNTDTSRKPREVPQEDEPYLKYIPQWLQDKLLR